MLCAGTVFYLSYISAELRRRKGRTILTALGLAVGVGLVVTVSALTTGLDRAQDKVLKPLTGVGTDMSVTRPLRLSGSGLRGLSAADRAQLQKENGGTRFGLANRGKAGSHFSDDNFVAAGQLSFAASEVAKAAQLAGAKDAAGGLSLTALHIEGTVPKATSQPQTFGGPVSGGATGAPPGLPQNINANSFSVTGLDESKPTLGAIAPSQITGGRYLRAGAAREAVLNVSYARRKGLPVGSTVKLKGKPFKVVGIARTPLGGEASDVYVKLAQLQTLSGRKGRVNVMYVRATDTDSVASVAAGVKRGFSGAQVTTSKELADRVGGSLKDAKKLTGKLGAALQVVGLIAAFLIASLLTLSSVTKRVRELGTLKALGWRQRQVVRQVTGESLAQSLLGGVLGAALGIAGAALITTIGPSLEATVAGQTQGGAGPGGPGGPGGPPGFVAAAFGQGNVTGGSTHIALNAPVGAELVLLAMALAVAGGLLAGAVGGLRAARLRPADALRHID